MASFKRTVELTHGESLFVAQALQFYKENLVWKIGVNNYLEISDDEVDAQIEVAGKIIPKFEIKVKETINGL
jgi:hypothetical protein